ncbi:MAG: tRNA-dihydrouridine synthase [Candidatus Amesbacteria bacterium GW2011_GWA1_46_35]|nr:MAG: tRNA-dihydrouridine synthase [Candidatus Amesbacteria bacterium GW2011_GWA1_46_35]
MNLWQKLAKSRKPFLALAPMEEVTDTVFRQMVAKVARPDVFFTEFTNVEGIIHAINNSPSDPSLLQRLAFTEVERPIVAQIWGKDPKNYYEAAKLIKRLRFDGVDINMGCPEKDVVKNGCCIALINNRSLAAKIIAAVKKGAGRLPVSVKTRIGLDKIVTEDWCGFLLEQKIDALTVHGRTARETSDVPAHWDEIKKVVEMRNEKLVDTVIIGNGDIKNAQEAGVRSQESGVDGVMIGRGVLESINAFSPQPATLSPQENINLLREHIKLWQKTWGDTKNFSIMKKFVKVYIKGWEGAGDLRARLFETKSLEEMAEVLRKGWDSNPR